MAKTAQHKLTSEQRCRKAFTSHFKDTASRYNSPDIWIGWATCWKYLQSHLEEYVKS